MFDFTATIRFVRKSCCATLANRSAGKASTSDCKQKHKVLLVCSPAKLCFAGASPVSIAHWTGIYIVNALSNKPLQGLF